MKEIETLEAMGACEVVDREEGMSVIDSIWVFKLKHYPDEVVEGSKPDSVLVVINNSKELTSLRPMLLFCNERQFI